MTAIKISDDDGHVVTVPLYFIFESKSNNAMSTLKPEYIVAIGGATEYLEPLLRFFDRTLNDSVSYVILRHISADAQNLLKEILQPHSKLEVLEGGNNMQVENNKVYVLPTGYYMTIKNKVLNLQERKEARNCAIDIFMDSLAADFKERSIGIFLSGGVSNGVDGATSIKKREVLYWCKNLRHVNLTCCR
ncbi:MAG: hypothetical protein JST50_07910 [Bacteroidetes bacterium]|nr:hypothetical protein [Bacteroidota bacterium]